jgi:hypothetical protein
MKLGLLIHAQKLALKFASDQNSSTIWSIKWSKLLLDCKVIALLANNVVTVASYK